MPYMLDGRRLRVGRPFTHSDGRQFGGNWNKYTTDELNSLGITYEADPAPYDPLFYYSAGNPVPIEDTAVTNGVRRVDADGNPVLDADGNEIIDSTPALDSDGNQIYSPGLRSKLVTDQAAEANALLSPTDWYVTRKAETDTAVPANVATYRAAVRTACDARQTEIAATTTTVELETLMKTAPGESGALTQWPEPLS